MAHLTSSASLLSLGVEVRSATGTERGPRVAPASWPMPKAGPEELRDDSATPGRARRPALTKKDGWYRRVSTDGHTENRPALLHHKPAITALPFAASCLY